MSGPVNVGSASEWQSLLSDNSVVVADFYADWCGPCKQIAPHFERLAKEYSRPKKVAFAKVNVDNQSTIAQSAGVAAMPTFKIYHGGSCVDTIKGANPSALGEAVTKAVKLANAGPGGKPADAFKSPGRTLGSDGTGGRTAAARRGPSLDLGKMLNFIVSFIGLYFVSLLSFDGYKAAEHSRFNVHKRPEVKQAGAKGAAPGASGSKAPAKPAFRTLADLGSE